MAIDRYEDFEDGPYRCSTGRWVYYEEHERIVSDMNLVISQLNRHLRDAQEELSSCEDRVVNLLNKYT